MPNAELIGVLINPANRNADPDTTNLRAAAKVIGVQVELLQASTERDIDAAFLAIPERHVDALLVGDDPFFGDQAAQLIAMASRYRVPTSYQNSLYAVLGGLISYGPDPKAISLLAGRYTGRILNGATPADLPVQQPTKFELAINLKTAKALGLSIPQSLLARADEVIE